MAKQLPSHISPHKAGFRVQITVGGRRVRRTFSTLEAAVTFRDELSAIQERDQMSAAARALRGSTIGDIVREWWEGPSDVPIERRRGHRDRVGARTRGDYQYLIDRFISDIASDSARAYAEQPGLLKAYYDSFTARVSVWRVHAILRQAFEYAVEQRWIDLNPAAGDLHLVAGASPIDHGVAIAGIQLDFDGQTRDALLDVGADE